MNFLISLIKNKVLPQSIFLVLVTFFRKHKKFGNIDTCITKLNIEAEFALDLGCGNDIANPFKASNIKGVDIKDIDQDNVYQCILGFEKLPFDDASFDCMTAFDLLEHIPRVIYKDGVIHNPFIYLMDEIYRCLKPGGYFLSHTPGYPSPAAFQDPTHVNIITADTFKFYFCSPELYAGAYGFKGSFDLIKQGWNGHHLITLLKKNY